MVPGTCLCGVVAYGDEADADLLLLVDVRLGTHVRRSAGPPRVQPGRARHRRQRPTDRGPADAVVQDGKPRQRHDPGSCATVPCLAGEQTAAGGRDGVREPELRVVLPACGETHRHAVRRPSCSSSSRRHPVGRRGGAGAHGRARRAARRRPIPPGRPAARGAARRHRASGHPRRHRSGRRSRSCDRATMRPRVDQGVGTTRRVTSAAAGPTIAPTVRGRSGRTWRAAPRRWRREARRRRPRRPRPSRRSRCAPGRSRTRWPDGTSRSAVRAPSGCRGRRRRR